MLLGSCGRNVVFGQNVVLRHPHKIRIGDNVVIDDNCLIDAKGETNGGITIGSGVFIGRNTILSCKNGDIVIGEGANIGFNCEMFSAARVELGPRDAAGRLLLPDRRRPRLERCRRAGAGAGTRRLRRHGSAPAPGLAPAPKCSTASTVGEDAVVGAGAVVNADVPADAIAVGVPARVVGSAREAGA